MPCHEEDADVEGASAAVDVAEVAEEEAAHGLHEEGAAEDHEGFHGVGVAALVGGKKTLPMTSPK